MYIPQKGRVLAAACLIACASFVSAPLGAEPLVVPRDFPTIQAAIDAAAPGGTVQVRAGTYAEQLSISKDLRLVGAGMDATVIRAPAAVAPGLLGFPSIVEIHGGASVQVSGLTVAGPGAVACGQLDGNGDPVPRLRWAVRVHGPSHLDFGFAAVRDAHDTPMAQCPQSGVGIAVGQPQPGSPASSADIHHSEVTNFQSIGVIGFGSGTRVNVRHSVIQGPGHAGGVPTDGIELVAGAGGTISHNVVGGNVCPAGFELECGPDFFTQFQHGGIVAGGNGPGTVITHNLVVGNQIGLYLSEVDEASHNVIVDSEYFAIGLVGFEATPFVVKGGAIRGGVGGVWVTAVFSDMTVVLQHVSFSGLAGPAVEKLECCGFTATVTGGP
jgi:hypothetical protein